MAPSLKPLPKRRVNARQSKQWRELKPPAEFRHDQAS
jgi:hypothetical protein